MTEWFEGQTILTVGGCLVLINSVLSSLSMFMMPFLSCLKVC